MAVTTNCALLCLSSNLRSYGSRMSPAEWLLLFVVIEHFLIGIKLGLAQLIPDIPSWVRVSLACLEYRSRQALKNEQTFKARRQLTRRFKTIHIAGKKGPRGERGLGNPTLTVPSTGIIQRRKTQKKQNTLPVISARNQSIDN